MKCEICKKNSAKIHITQVKDNNKFTIHICHDCSHDIGVSGPAINTTFSIEQFLSEKMGDLSETKQEGISQQVCPSCGLSFSAFKESGRLGCSLCYDTFINELKPILQKIHKNLRHVGKIPGKGDEQLMLKRDISDLRMQLKDAVSQEHFEIAAGLRDRVRQMEADLHELDTNAQ